MRGPLVTTHSVAVLVALAVSAATAGCSWDAPPPTTPGSSVAPEIPQAGTQGGTPGWVPALTPKQTALVAPLSRTIKAPAQRVFPDLNRFAYANNRPLASDEDAIKFTKMVNQVLNDSPRFYALDELPSDVGGGAANTVAQYGPAPSPADGFLFTRRGPDGVGVLTPAVGAEEARAAIAEAGDLERQGQREAAIGVYRQAMTRAPSVPALRVALAGAVARVGRAEEAEGLYREAISVDPTYAPAHLGLAELAEKRGDRATARHQLAEALAYHPPSTRALAMLPRLASSPAGIDGGWTDPPAPPASAVESVHADRFPIFLDVDGAGAVRVAAAPTEAAQIYGGCRAVMRYEPALRSQIFQQPRETPYSLSVAEEVVCLEAGLGAYLAKHDKPDPELEELLRIAREEGLSGYVMYEILGQHRPERARTAPPDVHRDTVAYLEKWVLSHHEPAPPLGGAYTAAR